MFDEVTDTPTVARTSNLNEELGQVSRMLAFANINKKFCRLSGPSVPVLHGMS